MAAQLILTQAGIAAVINAEQTGTDAVQIASVGLGTGKYTPTGRERALRNQFKTLNGVSGGATADDVIHIAVTDTSADAYTVYEVGVYTTTGVLFAVYSSTAPVLVKASASTVSLTIDIAVTDFSAESVTFGDTTLLCPSATTETSGIAELATAEETVAGTDASRVVTPAGLKAAIDSALPTATATRKGIAELATNAECTAGTDAERIVTPAGLKAAMQNYVPSASATAQGKVELATAAETSAGTDSARAVTPAGLKAALPSLLAGGYAVSTQLLTVAVASGGTVTVPAYKVGTSILEIHVNGAYVKPAAYQQVGSSGASSTSIKILFPLSIGDEITAEVIGG